MKINPLHDLVLIKPIEQTATPAGIVLPETARPGLCTGKVLACGPGTNRRDVFCRVSVSFGDTVRFRRSSDDEIQHEGQKLYLVRDEDILYTLTES